MALLLSIACRWQVSYGMNSQRTAMKWLLRPHRPLVPVLILFSVQVLNAQQPDLARVVAPNDLAELGRTLFQDKQLSADRSVSCATCHRPERAFTDGRTLAIGVNSHVGTRNTPSLLNVAEEQDLFWDGRARGLEEQISAPLFGHAEQAIADEATVRGILGSNPDYARRFHQIFSGTSPISLAHAATAIAAYERTLISHQSSFDQFRSDHRADAISASAKRGSRASRDA